jgi:glutathionylspermidine synthase
MNRISQVPRANWQKSIYDQGLIYNETSFPDGSKANYWNESAAYTFSLSEIDRLEAATAELFEMCIAAGDTILTGDNYRRLGIPESALPAMRQTWNDDNTPSIYGRFDFSYNGGEIKLLEFNADTPTALLETAAIQWFWLQDVHNTNDQFNSVHERLIAAWKRRQKANNLLGRTIHFASTSHDESGEDYFTTVYLEETARQAGLSTKRLFIEEIDYQDGNFIDNTGEEIKTIFKLYPWEWMTAERYGPLALQSITDKSTQWIEPPYKMLWSNKGLLPILWELYPGHPLLLESYFDGPGKMQDYASKPLLGREGQGIILTRGKDTLASAPGSAAPGRRVYQELSTLPNFEGNYPVIGSWIIDGEPGGIGIRESNGLITDNLSRFVPHFID